MPTTVPFDELADSDLVVDCVYKGGIERDARAEVADPKSSHQDWAEFFASQ